MPEDEEIHIELTDLDYLNPRLRASIISMFPKSMQRTAYSRPERLEPMPKTLPLTVILPDLPLFEAISDYLFEHDTYTRIPIKMGPLRFVKENPELFPRKTVIGLYSATDRLTRKKYVNRIPYTPTDYAMAYLKLCQMSANRILTTDYNKKTDIIPTRLMPVHYFSGPASGELAYIDIKFAYWQILWPTTIDMHYNWRNQEIESEGFIPYIRCDEFAKQKEIRNVMNTLYNKKDISIWNPETKKLERASWPSQLYRPYNMAYVYQVMHAIANDVKNHFHLLQWLTDAAIVPWFEKELIQEFLFEEWFIDSRLDLEGRGRSNTSNSYQIGDYETGGHDPSFKGKPHSNLWNSNIVGLKAERWAITHGKPLRTPKPEKPKHFDITALTCIYCKHPKNRHQQSMNQKGHWHRFFPCQDCPCVDYQYNSPDEIRLKSATPAQIPKTQKKSRVTPKKPTNPKLKIPTDQNFINDQTAQQILGKVKRYGKPIT
jgi:hypothetical protein